MDSMNTSAAKSTTADATMKDVLAVFEQFKLAERFRKLMALAKKEGCLYVAEGMADALKEAGVVMPAGIELRECKWMEKGTMVAVDSKALDPFKASNQMPIPAEAPVLADRSILVPHQSASPASPDAPG